MDINELNTILSNVAATRNAKIVEAMAELSEEYDKTKNIIIDLTKHMEILEENYKKLNKELLSRSKL